MRRVGGGEACLMWNPPWGAGNPETRADGLEGWEGAASGAGDKMGLLRTGDGRPEGCGAGFPKADARRVLLGREAGTTRRWAMVSEHDDKDRPRRLKRGGR